jgi:hypothetical protein
MWKAAIKTDKLNWINVSDMAGRGSALAILYKVPDDLPYMVLVDKDGNINLKTSEPEEIEEYLSGSPD